jgi:DNA-binding NarL/FixJ family response regulator
MSVEADEAQSPDAEPTFAALDLTECELIMAEGVLSGRSIKDIADRRGVCSGVIRSQARRMLARLREPPARTLYTFK